ncbi:MAG: preprotein translocase subunit SecG [Desulfotalea sp.]
MDTLLTIGHVVVCLLLVGIVLLQHGKGADAGAAFGGGSSQSVFGSEGPVPLLNKITTGVAIVFMITSMALAFITSRSDTGSIMTDIIAKPVATETSQVATPVVNTEAAKAKE